MGCPNPTSPPELSLLLRTHRWASTLAQPTAHRGGTHLIKPRRPELPREAFPKTAGGAGDTTGRGFLPCGHRAESPLEPPSRACLSPRRSPGGKSPPAQPSPAVSVPALCSTGQVPVPEHRSCWAGRTGKPVQRLVRAGQALAADGRAFGSHLSLPREKRQDPKPACNLLPVLALIHSSSSTKLGPSEPARLQKQSRSLGGGRLRHTRMDQDHSPGPRLDGAAQRLPPGCWVLGGCSCAHSARLPSASPSQGCTAATHAGCSPAAFPPTRGWKRSDPRGFRGRGTPAHCRAGQGDLQGIAAGLLREAQHSHSNAAEGKQRGELGLAPRCWQRS